MPLQSAEARIGGVATPLATGTPAVVEPASSFEVRVGAPLRDARLLLLDGQDVLVPAAAESEVSSTGSRFTLQPQEPLQPGGTYMLRLEGLGGRLVRSATDATYEPLVLPVKVSGSPPPRPPPKKAQKKRRG